MTLGKGKSLFRQVVHGFFRMYFVLAILLKTIVVFKLLNYHLVVLIIYSLMKIL